ncbi:28S ribosomal protein S11, mitochondrial [Trichonephila inaurata madagascariensis]|uniref:28S ribosomal protein S11, mitochondrial n=1 Tax=Trichonephila inaurata madagascariensis TaxID=2747483 RepID=A0A8X6XD27_9ARAC|nr:28S ribosomal protein S11, mitochondrial [Trichonephila inaurata madagascariensis]
MSALVKEVFNLAIKKCKFDFRKSIFTSNILEREFRKNKRQNIVIKEDKVPQEKSFDIEPAWIKKCDFPDENTDNMLFNGVRFADLPIVHIRVSKNNTIYMLTDAKGSPNEIRSCGIEGFKNTKKGTNIAAQATAISFSTRLLRKGFSQVRVAIKGLGPGRMASIKGLEMGGLNIVSITDKTPVVHGGNRPRKQRRL